MSLIVSEAEAGLRLDKFLAQRFPEQSRTYFQHLIEKQLVLLNESPVKKREKVAAGDTVEVEFALTPELSLEPENIPLDILYEDEAILVVNKPAGLVVHPGTGNWSHTFVNALLYHCQDLNLETTVDLRPGIVHRLDKDTTGLLIAAKTEQAQAKLVAAFASRQVKKIYLAICIGKPKAETIQTYMGRHPTKRTAMAVLSEGKLAITHVKPLKTWENLSLAEITLETGRTHQIRVHMQYRSTPILGDPIYGSSKANAHYNIHRQLLHAFRLEFSHPITGKQLNFEAPLPEDMKQFFS